MKKFGKKWEKSAERGKSRKAEPEKKKKALFLLEALLLVFLLGELFFSSLISALFLLPLGLVFYRKQKEDWKRKRQQKRKEEFRELLLGISSALSAGYSMENAWKNAAAEYQRNEAVSKEMLVELKRMQKKLEMNEGVERALYEFSERIDLEEAKSFSDIFRFVNYSGGNMNRIIHSTISRIEDKIEVEREILSVTAARRLEARIMNLIPLGILAYLRLASPGYLDPLYHNMAGIILMTVCLLVYIGAYSLAERMVVIEV
jgi:tight adherence protein B